MVLLFPASSANEYSAEITQEMQPFQCIYADAPNALNA